MSHPTLTAATIQKFWSRVKKASTDQCWIWVGGHTKAGYGVLRARGTQMYAHRVSYAIASGEAIPVPQTLVRHSCHTPTCVNPAHLSLGSKRSNWIDSRHTTYAAYSGKLCDDDVREIRHRYDTGETQTSIAGDYPISISAISRICRRETWAYVV